MIPETIFMKKFFFILFILSSTISYSQKWEIVNNETDTVYFKANEIVLTRDTIFHAVNDTFIILVKDSKYRIKIDPENESTEFYKALQKKTCKNKITQNLYHLLIKPHSSNMIDTLNFKQTDQQFKKYEGYKIKSIRIKQVDILDGSVDDTLKTAKSSITKTANNVHVNTIERNIKNNLLFKEGDLIDAETFADSERILRSLSYLEDAKIIFSQIDSATNEVDVLVITKDEFSIGVGIDVNNYDNFKIHLLDNNFLGIGHKMQHSLIYRNGYQPQNGYNFKYRVNNIYNTFISGLIEYENSWDRELKLISFRKTFLSPQTKYAGGIKLYKLKDARSFKLEDTVSISTHKAVLQDYWLGRAIRFSPSSRTRMNVAFRYARANFTERPYLSRDSNYFYRDRELFLSEIALLKRSFYKSRMVQGFGVTEDIPYGYILSLNAGLDKNQFTTMPYFGVGFTWAKYMKLPGYIGANFSAGAYYNKTFLQDAIINFELINIGNLIKLNRYRIRNYTALKLQYGTNLTDIGMSTKLNDGWTRIATGLKGDELVGTQKIELNYEASLFTPWHLIGFKVSPFVFMDIGWVSNDIKLGKNTSLYSCFGTGLRIKNESWVIETITIGLAYLGNAPLGSNRFGFVFDSSSPDLLKKFSPGKPEVVKMDNAPGLFLN